MKNETFKQKVRDRIRRYRPSNVQDAIAVLRVIDQEINNLKPAAIHAKEMLNEYHESPSLANRVCSELANDALLQHILDSADKVETLYSGLNRLSKEFLPKGSLLEYFGFRLMTLLDRFTNS